MTNGGLARERVRGCAMTRVDTNDAASDGVLEQRDDGRSVIRFQRRLEHPVERVWAALTQPEELVAWLAEAEVELVEGGRFDLRWLNTDDQNNQAVRHATITRLEPPHLLETSGDVHGVLRWELRADRAGTLLTFSSTLALPDEYRAKVLAGWAVHLDFLADALQGRRIDWPNWPLDRWEAHHRRYLERLG